MIFIECGKTHTRARARKGEAQGVLAYQKVTRIFDNPHESDIVIQPLTFLDVFVEPNEVFGCFYTLPPELRAGGPNRRQAIGDRSQGEWLCGGTVVRQPVAAAFFVARHRGRAS